MGVVLKKLTDRDGSASCGTRCCWQLWCVKVAAPDEQSMAQAAQLLQANTFLSYIFMLTIDNREIWACKRILASPAINLMKLSQINSAKMLEQGNSMQYWTHIPSTLPYKCPINLCTPSNMLGLLYQLPFLGSTSHQTSKPMEVHAYRLFFFVFA